MSIRGFVTRVLPVGMLTMLTTLVLVNGAGAANDKVFHKKPAMALGKDGHSLRPVVGTPTHVEMSGATTPPLAPEVKVTDVLLPDAPDSLSPEMKAKTPPTPEDTLLYAHLLRRAGFGPTAKDMKKGPKSGANGRASWINAQLNPSGIDDSGLKLPSIDPDNYDYDYIRAWYIRMAFSKRQLQEKMTLIWHEHFSVSDAKVGEPLFMSQHEGLMRANALGSFQTLLTAMVKDNAMLRWLDNDYNDGDDFSCGTNHNLYCPPNENFAREFMQLYTLGTQLLHIDGTPVLDSGGNPIPSYSENDVKILAKTFTGWHIDYCTKYPDGCSKVGLPSDFLHDINAGKDLFGVSTSVIHIPSYSVRTSNGQDTIADTNFVVDKILNGDAMRRDSIAAFIAKCLLQKIATENPSPQYTQAVAMAFRDNNWSIKEAVRAILTAVDPNTGKPYFESPANVRTMYKDPIEQYVGAVRALWGDTDGGAIDYWSYRSGQEIWYPPSVFSFYRPGQKSTLVSTAYVFYRDGASNEYVNSLPPDDGTFFKTATLIKKGKMLATNPQGIIDYLALQLVGAPGLNNAPGSFLHAETNTQILNFINTTPTATLDQHIQGVVYLILVSPDYQRN
jgi:uncharacterized protein (DUF1800 family)